MGRYVPDARQYFIALMGHIFTLAAGCFATVVLGLFQKYVLRRPLTPKWEIAIFLCFVFFAGFEAWQDEHRQRLQGEQKIEQGEKVVEELTIPKFQGTVTYMAFASSGKSGENCLVTMLIKITNRGAPSIADGFAVKASRNGKVYEVMDVPPPSKFVRLYEGDTTSSSYLELDAADYLPAKTMRTPIPHNGAATGFIQLVANGLSVTQATALGTVFDVRFADINGTLYHAVSLHGQIAHLPNTDEFSRESRLHHR